MDVRLNGFELDLLKSRLRAGYRGPIERHVPSSNSPHEEVERALADGPQTIPSAGAAAEEED
jgi:hypothetical protein